MGISIPSLLIILVIVILLFGTKKLRNMGGDLGGAIKNFRKAVSDGEKQGQNGDAKGEQIASPDSDAGAGEKGNVIEGEVKHKENH